MKLFKMKRKENNMQLLEQANPILVEPIMNVEIVVPEDRSSIIIADISKRRGEIQNIDIRGRNKVIDSLIPLSELLGYSTAIRIISSGTATFSIKFSHYKKMNLHDEEEAIRKVTGF